MHVQEMLSFHGGHASFAPLQIFGDSDSTASSAMQYIETDLQRLQMKLKVEPRHLHEAIEAEYAAAAKAKPVRRPIDLDPSPKSGGACISKCVLLSVLI